MEIIYLFLFASPFFYITGLVVFIRWLVHGGHTVEDFTKRKVAEEIRLEAIGVSPETARVLNDIAYRLDGVAVLQGAVAPAQPPAAVPVQSQFDSTGSAPPPAVASAVSTVHVPAGSMSGWHEPETGPQSAPPLQGQFMPISI